MHSAHCILPMYNPYRGVTVLQPRARLIGSRLGCPCTNSLAGSESVTAISCRIQTVWMIIELNLRWRTFRYWAVLSHCCMGAIGSSPAGGLLGNFSTGFDLKGTVSRDGFDFWWHIWLVLVLNRGLGPFLIFLGIPMILKNKKSISSV